MVKIKDESDEATHVHHYNISEANEEEDENNSVSSEFKSDPNFSGINDESQGMKNIIQIYSDAS